MILLWKPFLYNVIENFLRLAHHDMLSQNTLEKKIIYTLSSNDERAFDELALEIFNFQYEKNLPYQRYCKSLGIHHINYWKNIPAVPTDAFKMHNTPLFSGSAQSIQRTFHTSGTTTEIKGHHHFKSLEIYEQSILSGWNQLHLPNLNQVKRLFFLTEKPEHAPHSSLSHMMGVLVKHSDTRCHWLFEKGKMNTELLDNIHSDESIGILGTALGFLHLFEKMTLPLQFAKGSWAMETGGYKGTHHSLSKEDLYKKFQNQLSLPADSIINEYSMTELSSQFYTRGLGNEHCAPHWVRTMIIDPVSGKECPAGEAGYLRIFDLANLYSVMAIQTQDIAIASKEKPHQAFHLIGRDPSALPRGCSRAADSSFSA